MINKLSQQIHKNNKAKGFYDSEKNIGEMLALIHSEVSEALEADRNVTYFPKGLNPERTYLNVALINEIEDDMNFRNQFANDVKDTFDDELADIMIRVMDLAAYKGIDLESHITAKMRYNSLRPHKHGKEY